MAKRFKTSNNYFIVEDTLTGVEEIRVNKDNFFFIIYNENIDFYRKSTGRKISAQKYNTNNSVNGDDSDNSFADFNALKTFVESNTANFNIPQESGNVKEVFSLSDLPEPVSNNITLEADTAYLFKVPVLDLEGNRLTGQSNTSILGSTSETSKITSTGLSIGTPLFTSSFTTPIQNISFTDIDTALSFNGDSNTALDWDKFNIVNCPNIGTINGCSNWILTNSAFLNSKGLKFDGTIGTIGIDNSLMVSDGLSGSLIEVLPTCNITRRFRSIYSSLVVFGSSSGVNFNASATVPVEGYILDIINFSGGGTYLLGVDHTSNSALFTRCEGITNTSVNGQLFMRGNTFATAIANNTDFFKISGITTPSADNSKFNHANNRLTCKASIERKYLISCTLSFTTSNNNICEFGFFDSKLGDIRTPSVTTSTANSAGRQEGVTFSCVVQHNLDDYLEIHTRNTTGPNNITVTDMNFIVIEIK